ncbi:serine/threonine-protein kinase [Pseudonocardia broussonetiae]|uniref:non-specific serine/threonine protein kinase n=1 Tax=Pseudonocardia broussonetiae TaxID=2736640 RepID=A0A6M6JI19_9PSEU|nr:serine/threonine-protein kinase [Pseudonocardia broussonetiae]QJY47076.1 serine/threonine protein kinase [Pseudonocardia broussonetiae]
MNAPEDPPTRIGDRYRLEERIGAGAMGAVWRGTDELLNRPVALKELLAAASRGNGAEGAEEARQRLMREGRIGARLQHAHVISMFDVVIHEDRPWLVMEYLPSQSLAQVLSSKGPMEPRAAADMGRQVADGLAAAHLAGVVHRDVKPGNVLIGEDGRVKLTDFGVSRAVDDVQLTRTGLIAGTPAFLAPEIARGHEPAAPSDVFALGATLYAAVEGIPPFGLDENAYALLHKVATGEVDPPQQAGPLAPVLMRLLAKEPQDRPTAAQARDELALVATGKDGYTATTVVAPRPTVRTAAVLPPRGAEPNPGTVVGSAAAAPAAPAPAGRRRRRVAVLAGVLAALVVAGGIVTALLLNQSGETPQAQVPATPTSEPATTTESATTTTSAPPSTTTPTPTPTPSSTEPPAAPVDAVSFVQGYYSLLPGDTDSAWALLSPQAQSASGGKSGFDNFYGGMDSVTLQDARSAGDGVVEATVVFDPRDGATSSEAYRFVVAEEGGSPVIQSFGRR